MSDEENKKSDSPEAGAAKPEAAAKPAPAKAEPPPPPPAGKYGKLLEGQGIGVSHLGPDAYGYEMIDVPADKLLDAAKFLRDNKECRFDLLVSVSGVDWKEYRQSVYHAYSTETHDTLCLKVKAVDDHVPSVFPVWPAADWHERESYDLLGIIYDGHPDLRRILMPSDWLGHPLKKDYVVDDPRLVWNER